MLLSAFLIFCQQYVNAWFMCVDSDIEFDRKSYKLLAEEIEREGDELSLQIIVFGEVQRSDDADDVEDKVIGIASVNMWFMIEESCAIVLQVCFAYSYFAKKCAFYPFVNVCMQEVDVVDVESGTSIGSVVVDVRGHLCLLECAS